MNPESLQTLELNKILEYLAERSHSEISHQRFLKIHPSTHLEEIQTQLSQVSELKAILDFDDPFPMEEFADIRPYLERAKVVGNFLEPVEFIRLKNLLTVVQRVLGYFQKKAGKYPLLENLAERFEPLDELHRAIRNIIDDVNQTVRDNASKTLSKIRREINSTQDRIRKKVESIQQNWGNQGYLQESLITIREGRLVLMVKEQFRHRAKGVIHDQSSSGATLFMEPIETLDMNNQLRQLYLAEQQEVKRLLTELTKSVRIEIEPLEMNLFTLVDFDEIYTKAQFSCTINGCAPTLNIENNLNLMTARHPLLILKHKRIDEVVPLSIKMGSNFKTLIISGANAGGKTVALKTIGLMAVMIQCGLHIPVFPDSEMPVFENVFADIGDEQSIENDLSTFSSHIRKLRVITSQTTQRSLVLLDEVGSGTDPEEGAALASSILTHLTDKGCLTIATTHHGQLKAFAFANNDFENGSMQFNLETLEPTYQFQIGVPGSSYAFEIAQRFGLSPEIIKIARKFVGEEKRSVENLIIDLETRIRRQTELVTEMEKKQRHLNSITKEYEEKAERLAREERKYKKKAIEEAEVILRDANAMIEKTIKNIREQNASKKAIRDAKKQLGEIRSRVDNEAKKVKPEPEPVSQIPLQPDELEKNMEVHWKKFNSVAKILDLPDNSGKVLIEAGHMKIRVPLSELSRTSRKIKKEIVRSTGFVRYSMPDDLSTEIDLRGVRADEAVDKVDKFIDHALIAGLHEIRILHGKGTGSLKDAISQFLKRHPSVRSQREAAWNEGASGVTVVSLKG